MAMLNNQMVYVLYLVGIAFTEKNPTGWFKTAPGRMGSQATEEDVRCQRGAAAGRGCSGEKSMSKSQPPTSNREREREREREIYI